MPVFIAIAGLGLVFCVYCLYGFEHDGKRHASHRLSRHGRATSLADPLNTLLPRAPLQPNDDALLIAFRSASARKQASPSPQDSGSVTLVTTIRAARRRSAVRSD